MTDAELIVEVTRRTGLKPADVRAVLSAAADVRNQSLGQGTGPSRGAVPTPPGTPTDGEVVELIAAAMRHPLGLEFLLDGNLGAVAAIFGVHAFTVDAARQRLREEGAGAGHGHASS